MQWFWIERASRLSSWGEEQATEQNLMVLVLKVSVNANLCGSYTDTSVQGRKFGKGFWQTFIWERSISGLSEGNFSACSLFDWVV